MVRLAGGQTGRSTDIRADHVEIELSMCNFMTIELDQDNLLVNSSDRSKKFGVYSLRSRPLDLIPAPDNRCSDWNLKLRGKIARRGIIVPLPR